MEKIKREKAEKNKAAKKFRVAPYVRVSELVDYEEQGESVDKRPRVAAYVRTNGSALIPDMNQTSYFDSVIRNNPDWEFAGIYADYGKSGITVKNRPEFLRMIEDAKAGKIDVILTRSISRFSRNTHDVMEYTELLKGIGVEVRFENEGLSTMDCLFDKVIDCYGAFLKEQAKGGKMAWKL